MAIAGLVLGIVAVVFAFVPGLQWVGGICGIIGIVLCVLGKKKLAAAGSPTGTATAGLVLCIIGTVFALIMFVSCYLCASAAVGAAGSLLRF